MATEEEWEGGENIWGETSLVFLKSGASQTFYNGKESYGDRRNAKRRRIWIARTVHVNPTERNKTNFGTLNERT